MGLFDSFAGKKPQNTEPETLIIPDTIEDTIPQSIEIEKTDILDGYTIQNPEPIIENIEEIPENHTSENTSDILLTEDVSMTQTQANTPQNPINLNTPETAPSPSIQAPSPVSTPPQDSLLDTVETPKTEEIPDLFGATAAGVVTASALTVDTAVSQFEENLKQIKETIGAQKDENIQAIKETEEKLKNLKKEKIEIEKRESRLEELKTNILNTKKPTPRRRTSRTKTTK